MKTLCETFWKVGRMLWMCSVIYSNCDLNYYYIGDTVLFKEIHKTGNHWLLNSAICKNLDHRRLGISLDRA